MSDLKDKHPKVHEIAERKLELSRQMHEMQLEVAKLNEALLKDGSAAALAVVACW